MILALDASIFVGFALLLLGAAALLYGEMLGIVNEGGETITRWVQRQRDEHPGIYWLIIAACVAMVGGGVVLLVHFLGWL